MNRYSRRLSVRAAAFAAAFPAFAALDTDQLLELVEETNRARALAARGEHTAADTCFAAVVARLGIGAEVDHLTAALCGEIGDHS